MPLLIGLVIGILMCIPVGPINIWVVNTQLRRGTREAFSIALGGSLMDFLYFVVLSSGVSLLPVGPAITLSLKCGGVLMLMGFGVKELFWAKAPETGPEVKLPKVPGKESERGIRAMARFFLFGVLIYISNPTLIATLTGLTAMIRSWNMFVPGLINHLWLGLGAAMGSALWFYALLAFVRRYQHIVQGKALLWASRACGALVIVLAMVMGFKVLKEIRLSQAQAITGNSSPPK